MALGTLVVVLRFKPDAFKVLVVVALADVVAAVVVVVAGVKLNPRPILGVVCAPRPNPVNPLVDAGTADAVGCATVLALVPNCDTVDGKPKLKPVLLGVTLG